MFRGRTKLILDGKGRISVPAKYRDALTASPDGKLILTADPSQCLLLYPKSEWDPIESRLNKLSSFNAETRQLQRLIVGNATEMELDSAGRILLSTLLREFAALEMEVMFVGQGNKFEIWNPQRWDAQMAGALTFGSQGMPPELEGFSL